MPQVAAEIVALIYKLLPGFVAAWIFYGLTAHPKKGPFERTVQALIFTVLIQAVVISLRWSCTKCEQFRFWPFPHGPWTDDASFFVSIVLAFVVGVLFSWFANQNLIRWIIPRWISKRTTFPSEWYSAFWKFKDNYVYLHLRDGRRLYGWPTEWPDSPKSGHFAIEQPAWILDDNRRVPLLLVAQILVRAVDVKMVEFEIPERDWKFDRDDQTQIEALMVELNQTAEAKDERENTSKSS